MDRPASTTSLAAARRSPWSRWLGARVVALALGGAAVAANRGNVFYDTTYYAHWVHGTLDGSRIPYRDFAWEYPPGALPAMVVLGLFAPLMTDGHGSAYVWLYGVVWVAAMLAVDAAVLRSLLRRVGGGRRHPAVVLWTWGLPLLGALSWARYDLLPAAVAGAAVLAAGAGAPVRSGSFAGVGAALKLWPALLAPVQRSPRAALQATVRAVLVVAVVAAATYAATGSTGFDQVLSYQRRRGLQCESVAALPLLWLRHLHVGGYRTQFRFGAWEVTGPHVGQLVSALTVALALGVVGLGVRHWRMLRQGDGASAVASTAVSLLLLTLLTDKVLSPQYLLWLLAVLAAACVLDPATWRRYVGWVLLACGSTAVAFPWQYGDVLGHDWAGLLALTVRDLTLLGVAVSVALRSLRRPARDLAARPPAPVLPVTGPPG